MHGFQLWANLPSALKMTAPRYQDITSGDIPAVTEDDGTTVRVVCGSFWGATRPGGRHGRRAAVPGRLGAAGPAADATRGHDAPRVRVRLLGLGPLRRRVGAATRADRSASATPARAGRAGPTTADNRSLVLFDSGDEISVQAGDEGIRFLLVSGKPIEEPVAWYGPIVMNTPEELQQAFDEFRAGTFLRHK